MQGVHILFYIWFGTLASFLISLNNNPSLDVSIYSGLIKYFFLWAAIEMTLLKVLLDIRNKQKYIHNNDEVKKWKILEEEITYTLTKDPAIRIIECKFIVKAKKDGVRSFKDRYHLNTDSSRKNKHPKVLSQGHTIMSISDNPEDSWRTFEIDVGKDLKRGDTETIITSYEENDAYDARLTKMVRIPSKKLVLRVIFPKKTKEYQKIIQGISDTILPEKIVNPHEIPISNTHEVTYMIINPKLGTRYIVQWNIDGT